MLLSSLRTPGGLFQIFAWSAAPATVLLVILVGYNLARITWNLIPVPPSAPPPAHTALNIDRSAPRGPNIKAILDSHLFGKAEVTRTAPVASRPVVAPETPLNVTLRGIISAHPPAGWIIIAENGGTDKFYRLGAAISGGAVIKEIQPQKVVMLRNQRVEELEFPKDKDAKGKGQGGKSVAPSMPVAMPTPEPEPEASEPEEETPAEEETPVEEETPEKAPPPQEEDPNQSLNYYREQLLDNPANLAGLLQTQPVYRNGKLEGFRIRPGAKNANLLERFGLQSNDLVTSLNGIPLDNPMKAFEVLRGLRNAATLEVGVSRQGRNENVTLRFSR